MNKLEKNFEDEKYIVKVQLKLVQSHKDGTLSDNRTH